MHYYKKNSIKKYSRNLLICYLAILTGCTNTIPNNSSKTSFTNAGKESTFKNTENKYNLPTLDIPEKKEEIKIKKNNIFEPSYSNSQEQTSINSRDKKTGDAVDLQTMAMGLANSEVTESVKNWFATKHATAELSIGAGESGIRTGSFDLLVPLVDSEKDLFFTQVGARRSNRFTEDYRNTINLGLGYRHTIDKWMLGVNSFYDRDTTAGNERIGVGVEAWTDFLKLSGNSYTRISNWQQSKAVDDYQERPANGWDLRAEAYLPQYPQLGGKLVYEQYYGDEVGLFGSSSRQKDPSATTFGVSYTPIPLISMSTDYRQGQNGMSETSVRLGLNFQFGVPLKKQLSADELRASRLLSNARYNLVSRNNEIVLDFKKNETGTILLPLQIKGVSNELVSFPVNITGEVRNITWTGTASSYARTYGGATTASLVLPLYNATGINNYTLQAIGSDKYGKLVTSNVMQIGVESLKITVASSTKTALANGNDEILFTALLTKQTGEVVPNGDITWNLQGNATVVEQENKTDVNGKAKLKINSKAANTIVVTASEAAGSKSESTATFLAVEEESTAKVVNLTATPNLIHADGISTSTIIAIVHDVNDKPVKSGAKVDWTATSGTLSSASTETDDTGKASVTIKGTITGSSTIKANAIKGSASTTVTFDAIPPIVNTVNVNSSTETLLADNLSQSTFTVTVKDSNNNPLSNVVVNWSKNVSDGSLSNSQSTTNASGQATVLFTSGLTVGNLIITATTANGSANKTITLVSPPVTVITIELSSNNETMLADGTSQTVFTATVKDSNGNLLNNETLNWSKNLSDVTLSTDKSTTNALGQAVVTVTSGLTAGDLSVTATLGNVNKTKIIKINTVPVNAPTLNLTTTSPIIFADEVSTATLIIMFKDGAGNPIANSEVDWSATVGAIEHPKTVTDSNGQSTNRVRSVKMATTSIITATTGGLSQNVSVEFEFSTAKVTSFEPQPQSIKADGIETTTLIATVKNSDGSSARAGIPVNFSQGLQNFGTLSSNRALTDSSGKASITFSGTVALSTTISAGVDGEGTVVNTTVDLTPAYNYSATIDVPSPSSIQSDGVDFTNLVAHVKNADGTPAANVQLNWATEGGNLSSSTTTTDSNGNSSVRFTSTKIGTAFILAIPIGANTSKAGFTNVAVVDQVAPLVTTLSILTNNSYLVASTYTDPGSGTTYQIRGGVIVARVTQQDGPATIPVANKRVTFECIDGSKCLSQIDGSSLLPATTVTTDSNGLAYIQPFGPSVNNNDSILFRASYTDDASVAPDEKILSVSL